MEKLSGDAGRESMCELKIRTDKDILIVRYPPGLLTEGLDQKEMHELQSNIPNLQCVSLKEPISGRVSLRLHFPIHDGKIKLSKEELAMLIKVPERTAFVAQAEHLKEPPV